LFTEDAEILEDAEVNFAALPIISASSRLSQELP
jgi:hypothetical protein